MFFWYVNMVRDFVYLFFLVTLNLPGVYIHIYIYICSIIWDKKGQSSCSAFEAEHSSWNPEDADLDALGRSERFQLLLLDWENVGIGSGPQEIGQFLISHMDPTLRTKVEKEVVEVYYKCLVSANPRIAEDMTFEQCWREYIIGGQGCLLRLLAIRIV